MGLILMIWAMIDHASKRVVILYESVLTSAGHIKKAANPASGTSANPARHERAPMIAAIAANTDTQPDLSSNFKINRLKSDTRTSPPSANRQPGCKSPLKTA